MDNIYAYLFELYCLSRKWFDLNWEDGYSENELKKQYRDLAKKHHSDVNKDTTTEMREIVDAYFFLKSGISLDEDIIHNEYLKELRQNFNFLLGDIEYDKTSGTIGGKKGQRLKNNSLLIGEQIDSIAKFVKKCIKAIDLYILNNPNSTVTNYLILGMQGLLNEKVEYYDKDGCMKRKRCKMFAASLNYSEYRRCYEGCYVACHEDGHNVIMLGYYREKLRKARNRMCATILDFSKVMLNYLMIINNGTIEEVIPDKESQSIINTTYLKDYSEYKKFLNDLKKAVNYYCYLTPEEIALYKTKKRQKNLFNNIKVRLL